MSVKLRSGNEKRQRRRKRVLALPFIVSIALAPGCVSSGGDKGDTNKTQNPPTTAG